MIRSSVLRFLFLNTMATWGELSLKTEDFLETHCYDCHDESIRKGGLDLTGLDWAGANSDALAMWTRVFDRVDSGEMPPKKKDRPTEGEKAGLLAELGKMLIEQESARFTSQGRTVARRLNRTEYEATLRDLLELPRLEVKAMLPPDAESHGFDNVSAAHRMSYVQIDRYLAAGRHALEEAAWLAPKVSPFEVRIPFRDLRRFQMTNDLLRERDRPVLLRQPNTAQTPWWLRGVDIPFHGTYRVRVRARAVSYLKVVGQEAEEGVVKAGEGTQAMSFYQKSEPLGTVIFGGELETKMFTMKLRAHDELTLYCPDLSDWNPDWKKFDKEYRGPGVELDWLEVSGPMEVEGERLPDSYHSLFGDLPVKFWQKGDSKQSPALLQFKRGPKDFPKLKAEGNGKAYVVITTEPQKEARRLLESFMLKACRSQVTSADVEPFAVLIDAELSKGKPFQEAFLTGAAAVLASPDFLFFKEEPGVLDDHALAARLSYFLWRSLPDKELRKMAVEGRLRGNPEELRRQTERLLRDEKSRRFVDDFTDQWLKLEEIRATQPDELLYPEYDDFLLESLLAEPRLYFQHLVDENLPIKMVADSDFAFVNQPLAKLYDLPGEFGAELVKTTLPAGSPRGGFMTQGGILKVTANGTTTSPVVRGTWVLEHLLGTPSPPPPPDVPAIEPDTRGATTVRDLLEKHRADTACAGCHQLIDPPGFALESFDVIGRFRENYRSLGTGKPVPVIHETRPVKYRVGPVVDPSGVMLNGEIFADIIGFKRILLQNEKQLARNLTGQLMTFATGAGVSFSDRPVIEKILSEQGEEAYRLRDLIHAIVQSSTFQNK